MPKSKGLRLNLTRTALFAAVSVFVFCLAPVWAGTSGGHGQGHSEFHDWYESLRIPGTNFSCCNDEDCRPTKSRMVGRDVQVIIDGEWVTVPPNKIVREPSPDLGAHVCASKKSALHAITVIHCVVLGAGV
jgi:hypothetical protein